MTQIEFTQRTKVTVSDNEFWQIHEVYCNSDLDKDEFCKMWCKMNASRVKAAKDAIKAAKEDNSKKVLKAKVEQIYERCSYLPYNMKEYRCYAILTDKEMATLEKVGIDTRKGCEPFWKVSGQIWDFIYA